MDKYGMLTIIEKVPDIVLPCGQKNKAFLCRCDCGKEKVIRKVHLFRGRIKSCGCIGKDVFGESKTKLYTVWNSIRTRCKPNHHEKHIYYDRGIAVCNEWLDSFQAFKSWAIANGYKHGLQIDRIDNYLGYSPENCRFVDSKTNCNNRRNTTYVQYEGKKESLRMLVDRLKIEVEFATIYHRIKRGWDPYKAIHTPARKLTKRIK
jgi:hypothetical protein